MASAGVRPTVARSAWDGSPNAQPTTSAHPHTHDEGGQVFDLQKLLFGMHAARSRHHHNSGHHAHDGRQSDAHSQRHRHQHGRPDGKSGAALQPRRQRTSLSAAEERFEDTLLDPKLGLPFALLDVAPRVHTARTALSLVLALEWHGFATRLITALVAMETGMSPRPVDFFGDDRPGAHALRAFMRIHGLRFVRNALVLPFADLAEHGWRLRTERRLIADPSRVDPLDVMLAAQETADALVFAADKVPVSIKRVVGEVIDRHTRLKGRRASEGPVAAARVFFTHFVCPAVASPGTYALSTAPLDHYAKRVVVLVARLLSNAGTGTMFVEPTLAPFNVFIEDTHPKLVALMSRLAARRTELPTLAHEMTPFTIPPPVRVSALEFLFSVARDAREDLEALVARTQSSPPLSRPVSRTRDNVGVSHGSAGGLARETDSMSSFSGSTTLSLSSGSYSSTSTGSQSPAGLSQTPSRRVQSSQSVPAANRRAACGSSARLGAHPSGASSHTHATHTRRSPSRNSLSDSSDTFSDTDSDSESNSDTGSDDSCSSDGSSGSRSHAGGTTQGRTTSSAAVSRAPSCHSRQELAPNAQSRAVSDTDDTETSESGWESEGRD
eukprot:Opistho-2@27168